MLIAMESHRNRGASAQSVCADRLGSYQDGQEGPACQMPATSRADSLNELASTSASAGARTGAFVVLIIDDHEAFGASLGKSFSSRGYNVWLERHFDSARLVAQAETPDIIVMELRVAGAWAFDHLSQLRQLCPKARIVIATAYPAVATAVRAIRLGASAFLVKPVTSETVISTILDGKPEPPENPHGWPSLDRTIWEYLNQVFVTAGSMSEAARRLGIDRRSLRRMLAKYPPAR
jgi:two-component system response regulator RegA